MATRKFDYESVKQVYSEMNNTIGSASDTQSIAGILTVLDKEVHDDVAVCDQAVYGPLGDQLLLDWENTSSNFSKFIDSFGNWSKLIAMSAGDYSQFEKDLSGFKEINPLGTTSGGITSSYVDGNKFSDYTSKEIDDMSKNVLPLFANVGDAYYLDTGRVGLEDNRRLHAGFSFGLNAVATATSVVGIGQAVSGVASCGSAAGNLALESADDIAGAGAKALIGTADDVAGAGAKALIGTADDAGAAAGKLLLETSDDVVSAGVNVASDVGTGFVTISNGQVVSSVGEVAAGVADDVGTGFVAISNGQVISSVGGVVTGTADDVVGVASQAAVNSADDFITTTGRVVSGVADDAVDDAARVVIDAGDVWVYGADGRLVAAAPNAVNAANANALRYAGMATAVKVDDDYNDESHGR